MNSRLLYIYSTALRRCRAGLRRDLANWFQFPEDRTLSRGLLEPFFSTALSTGQVVEFLLVDADLPGLLHLRLQVRQKQPEKLLALGLQQRVANRVFLRRKFLVGRLLLLQE